MARNLKLCQEKILKAAEIINLKTYILMFKSSEDFYFSQRPLTVRLVLKWGYFLDRHFR